MTEADFNLLSLLATLEKDYGLRCPAIATKLDLPRTPKGYLHLRQRLGRLRKKGFVASRRTSELVGEGITDLGRAAIEPKSEMTTVSASANNSGIDL